MLKPWGLWLSFYPGYSRRTISFPVYKSNKKGEKMIEKSEYKGKPIIVIKRSEDDKFPFSFGLSKARLILENLEEIKKFVEENPGK